ncbi:helix-turn-helix domain-containing protein [Streptococcus agalactiae]|uniref:helix-turn-helix domain-containing protein n=1 Tax=Streptococcus TaxID=1301 RepID=UPI0003655C8A|nr:MULTISPECIES: helix-turn-helix transcriptional regulator [Streptococcus]OFP94424.1 transcriptional regulator [Streptococcus sp. HMSC067A03]UTX64855.1 transcriptional regulator [Streptococcus constellatus]HEO3189498.1 helix-turn-helix domain-containing protein [Streptococcus agalactiae]
MTKFYLRQYIGKRVRTLRKIKSMSQQALSEKADVGTDYISNLETKGSNIKIDTLEKILTALDSNTVEFFESQVNTENKELQTLVDDLLELPSSEQKQLLTAFQILIETVKDKGKS